MSLIYVIAIPQLVAEAAFFAIHRPPGPGGADYDWVYSGAQVAPCRL